MIINFDLKNPAKFSKMTTSTTRFDPNNAQNLVEVSTKPLLSGFGGKLTSFFFFFRLRNSCVSNSLPPPFSRVYPPPPKNANAGSQSELSNTPRPIGTFLRKSSQRTSSWRNWMMRFLSIRWRLFLSLRRRIMGRWSSLMRRGWRARMGRGDGGIFVKGKEGWLVVYCELQFFLSFFFFWV